MPFSLKVGCCSLRFVLRGNQSLKDKRRIVRKIKDRLKNKFNISVAEIGDQDMKNNLYLGVAAISSDSRYLDSLMEQVISFVDNMHLADIADHHVELIHLGHGP